MSDRAAKKAKRKARLEKKRRRYMELGFIISGISEDETDSEEDESEEQYQQGKGKEKNVDGKFDQSRKSVGGSMSLTSNQDDPSREKVTICIAGSQSAGAGNEDWIPCIAKFDSGADDDWISEELVSRTGLLQKEAEALECKNFDGTKFISDQYIDNLTWQRKDSPKTICGPFRILPDAPYELVIGKTTLFREKIFSVNATPRAAGVLVTKKITKERVAANKAKAEQQKADSAALLAKQAQSAQAQAQNPTQPQPQQRAEAALPARNNGRERPRSSREANRG